MKLADTLEIISESQNYNQWIYHIIEDYLSGTILDIGSGFGDIAKYFTGNSKVSNIIMTDNSDVMIKKLTRDFQGRDPFKVIKMDIENVQYGMQMYGNSADVVTCINVLEHIMDEKKALKNMHSLLRPQGLLLLFTPALPCIYGTLDEIVGHYRRYNKHNLNTNLAQAGFTVKKQCFMNFFGIGTWYIAGRILKRRSFNSVSCRVLDKIVPFLEQIENIVKPIIGQSFLTVCVKK